MHNERRSKRIPVVVRTNAQWSKMDAAQFVAQSDQTLWPFATLGFKATDERHVRATTRSIQLKRPRILFSNNWAIRKSFLKQFSRDEVLILLANHLKGHKLVARNLGIPAAAPTLFGLRALHHDHVRVIHDVCSLYNAHVGSIYFLTEAVMKDDPVRFLQCLDNAGSVQLPPYATPFMPYVRRMEALGSMLLPRLAAE